MITSVKGGDGLGIEYSFGVYDIRALPSATNAVYLFCKIENGNYVPLYIGKAENLSNRLSGHERKDEAIRLGAKYLFVHAPGFAAMVGYLEVERRLIARYDPVLNTHHRNAFANIGGRR
jgi:excinuclease UvrABC nuclease subunit